jgi:hypothetical protein
MSLLRIMFWRCVRENGLNRCWKTWEFGCLRKSFRGCCMFMLEVLRMVRFRFSFSFFHTLILLVFLIAEEARSMLQGVGSRFDFHINKTLCDLRFVFWTFLCYGSWFNLRTKEIFDIIIDFPDSMGALHDLRVLWYISFCSKFLIPFVVTRTVYREWIKERT